MTSFNEACPNFHDAVHRHFGLGAQAAEPAAQSDRGGLEVNSLVGNDRDTDRCGGRCSDGAAGDRHCRGLYCLEFCPGWHVYGSDPCARRPVPSGDCGSAAGGGVYILGV